MFPVIFKIGGFELHTYGVMLALAFAIGLFLAVKRGKLYDFTPVQVLDTSMIILISAIIGSRIAYVLFHLEEFRGRWWDTVNPFQSTGQVGLSGLIFLGGVIAALAAGAVYLKRKQLSFARMTDVVAPSLVLGVALGRVGCFFNGCCFGKVCHLPWGIRFPEGSFADYVSGGAAIHPTQLYAVLYNLLIFIVLWRIKPAKVFPGFHFAFFMVMYGFFRFFNESLRWYQGSEAGLNIVNIAGAAFTFSQIVSVFMLVVGLIIILKNRSRRFDTKP